MMADLTVCDAEVKKVLGVREATQNARVNTWKSKK